LVLKGHSNLKRIEELVKIIQQMMLGMLVFTLTAGIICPGKTLGMTAKQEETLAEEFLNVVLNNYKLIKDPLIINYINRLGNKILSTMPIHPFKYRFYMVQEEVYNAFAGPAGHIFLNSGLVDAMESEEELVGILAHEIAHVKLRHISQKIEKSKKLGIAAMAGIVASIFLGGGGAVGNALMLGSAAAAQTAMLAYSREDEMQADQIGLKYLAQSGYNGDGLLTVLNKIRSKQWFGTDHIPNYLSTHPASEDRMAYISTWIATHPKIPVSKSSSAFATIHTRLAALYGEKTKMLRQFRIAVEKNPDDLMARYGYALVLSRADEHQAAIVQLKEILQKKAFDRNMLIELGRIYFMGGEYQQALRTLENVNDAITHNPLGLFYLGRTQLLLNQFGDAEKTFARLAEQQPIYPPALYYLGETYGKQEKLDEAHYYLGRYFKETRRYKNAIFHLKKARHLSKDPEKRSQIDRLLKSIPEGQS
jgi:predicted Zn-dependent protease